MNRWWDRRVGLLALSLLITAALVPPAASTRIAAAPVRTVVCAQPDGDRLCPVVSARGYRLRVPADWTLVPGISVDTDADIIFLSPDNDASLVLSVEPTQGISARDLAWARAQAIARNPRLSAVQLTDAGAPRDLAVPDADQAVTVGAFYAASDGVETFEVVIVAVRAATAYSYDLTVSSAYLAQHVDQIGQLLAAFALTP